MLGGILFVFGVLVLVRSVVFVSFGLCGRSVVGLLGSLAGIFVLFVSFVRVSVSCACTSSYRRFCSFFFSFR